MSYQVKLEIFEGPLDLLLYLIQKNELDIHDIPIRLITDQYLEYLELMRELNLELAGEFLALASLLMRIKSKTLLPEDEAEALDQEEQDPRQELVDKLLEYMKYKDAASQLRYMEEVRSVKYERSGTNAPEASADSPFYGSSLFDLITAFSKVLKGMSKEVFHKVIKDKHTVSDKVHFILNRLSSGEKASFSSLFDEAQSKIEAITIFLAILELVRMKEIMVDQDDVYGEILIAKNFISEEDSDDISALENPEETSISEGENNV